MLKKVSSIVNLFILYVSSLILLLEEKQKILQKIEEKQKHQNQCNHYLL